MHIEKDIIDLLFNSVISLGRDKFSAKILLYFLTRRELTQKMIQELTGFSAGKISQELNLFVDMGLISIVNKSPRGEIIYSIPSIEVELFTRGINIFKSNLRWEHKFLEIYEELKENREEFQKLNGYKKIMANIQENLGRFGEYKKILNLWEKMKLKYSKM
ncbi:MAG: hypothetical protein ACFFAS_14970 [Promethearchaeota archaeon]